MEFELKQIKLVGTPGTKKFLEKGPDNKIITVEKYGINVVIITKIVGNPYDGFCNNDTVFYELDRDETINVNDDNLQTFAHLFIEDKYPNT